MSQRVCAVLLAVGCAGAPARETGAPQPMRVAAEPVGRAAPPAPQAPAPPVAEPPAKAARPPEGAIGTAHPLVVQASSPSGNWVAFCQARTDSDGNGKIEVQIGPRGELRGDELGAYFAVSSGEGSSIDELLAHDQTGKYVIFRRDGRTLLFDVERASELDLDALGADTRSDALLYRQHRSLAFDSQSGHLLYLRRAGAKVEVVLRELASGSERTYDPGPGEVWRAELEPSGRFIVLHVIRDDSNKNGRLEWPVPERKPGRRCPSPIPTYPDYSGRGDREQIVIVPRAGGAARAVQNLVTLLGDDVVRRESDGRLLLERATGTLTLTSDKCAGRVVHADGERGLLVVGCVMPKNRTRQELYLVGPGLSKALGIDLALSELDRPAGGSPRLLALYPGADTVLLDMDRKSLIRQEPGDQVVATFADRALIRRQRRLFYLTLEPEKIVDLGVELERNPELLVQGGHAYVSPWLVDLVSGTPRGPVPKRALALTRTGQLLIAEGREPSAEQLAIGPLRWLDVAAKR